MLLAVGHRFLKKQMLPRVTSAFFLSKSQVKLTAFMIERH
jgi:hypothetical protein